MFHYYSTWFSSNMWIWLLVVLLNIYNPSAFTKWSWFTKLFRLKSFSTTWHVYTLTIWFITVKEIYAIRIPFKLILMLQLRQQFWKPWALSAYLVLFRCRTCISSSFVEFSSLHYFFVLFVLLHHNLVFTCLYGSFGSFAGYLSRE